MATTMKKIFLFVLLVITTFTTVLFGSCSATVYTVGDSAGWIAKEGLYYEWAKEKVFYVGDSLVFKYDPYVNDVTQVWGALELEFCESSSPKAVYNTGHDVVTFTEPGDHYFISSNQAQCVLGQRLDVLVVHDPSRPIPPPPPSKILPSGEIYKVGDSNAWSVPEESDYYNKWSQDKLFHVGDSLLFLYDKEVNDVLEITGDLEFITCDPTSRVAVHKTGHDLVTLTKPGVHYFISSETGHCAAGLKLRVVVGPLPKPVTFTNFPKKMDLSAMHRLTEWLNTFIPQPHH
ncbi:PREDICTED: uncharacterized protein LOC104746846 [Camelina sativa]|uniref:Uncharacterized protein LOC104712397 n=1 Tax=Camelina sativa TaxID=90675 RepID=A0ABM0TK60_CAMSA|nr:PREDICTED: uncharacterized protein LOC104712397 [Camelina sativa]XP_010466686.1 PREDICTED: uncharacterized protein LOC104746846 [Camelina sativa]